MQPSLKTLVLLIAAIVSGCGLERPADPPGLDCTTTERAAERFPDECGPDAGEEPDADVDAGP